MLVYFYNENKEFIGTMNAFINPVKTEQEGAPKYFLPENSTFVKPQENNQMGWVMVWHNELNMWVKTEDHRRACDDSGIHEYGDGVPYWLEGDNFDTPPRYMTSLGAYPQGAMLTCPLEPESHKIETAAAAVRKERNKRLAESDFIMGIDVYNSLPAFLKEKWAEYRADLRSLPSREGFPWLDQLVPWPDKPEVILLKGSD